MSVSTLSQKERTKVLEKISEVVTKRFYDPQLHGVDWPAAVEKHRYDIVTASSDEAFDDAVMRLLGELKSSHTGFYHIGLTRATSKMAICATYAAFPFREEERWVFQDVHQGGPAAKAGIRPGDILVSVDGRAFCPPRHPMFPIGQTVTVNVLTSGLQEETRTVMIPLPKRKFNQLPYVEPEPVVSYRRLDRDTGYIKISMYPGEVGIEVANDITNAVQSLNPIDRLILDLRGNTGGGIGVLRAMSMLTSAQLPVGCFLSGKLVPTATLPNQSLIFDRIPARKRGLFPLALKFVGIPLIRKAMGRKSPIILMTEGGDAQGFHGRIVLLVDRHTASANEMLVAFARKNKLATIIGEATPGRVLAGSKFKMPYGYWLALPVGKYQTTDGDDIEGKPIDPDVPVIFNPELARMGRDTQLETAIEFVARL